MMKDGKKKMDTDKDMPMAMRGKKKMPMKGMKKGK